MKIWWTSEVFIMAVLCLTTNADNKASDCEMEIKVHRQTNHHALVGEELKIACPVRVCDNSLPLVTWVTIEPKDTNVNLSDRVITEWTRTNMEGISYLIFKKVLSSDAGLYRCRITNDVSHSINVTITGSIVNDNKTLKNVTHYISTPNYDGNKHMWLYLYSAVGIGGIVIIVIVISVLAMRGCKGKVKSQHENQYMDIPMVEQPQHHTSNQTLPRRSPREPPSHRTSRKQKSPLPVPPRDNVYGQRGDRERQRNGPVEEWSSVVYAALNHQHMAAATPRQRMEVEETSEYAAIRVS